MDHHKLLEYIKKNKYMLEGDLVGSERAAMKQLVKSGKVEKYGGIYWYPKTFSVRKNKIRKPA